MTEYMSANLTPSIELAVTNMRACMDTKTTMLNQASASGAELAAEIYILLGVLLAVVIGISLFLGIYISAQISSSVNQISGAVNKVAAGDFTVDMSAMNNRSELGVLSRNISVMIERLRDVLIKVSDVSMTVDDTSRQVASSSMSLAQISTEQASSAEEISASMADITTRTRANSENAHKATEISDGTREKASQGNERMNEMLKAMQAINDSSSNISNIIKVIDDIAFQTNILALNAAVEAARAGSHGKGFAVVAEEVRTLAARSATAASETTNMIENSINEVERGTVIAKDTAVALKEIVKGVVDTSELIRNIENASTMQADEAGQISAGVDQVSQAIQTTSSVAEEAASSSSELADQSRTLKELVSAFTFSVGDKRAQSAGGGGSYSPGNRAIETPRGPVRGMYDSLPKAAGAEGMRAATGVSGALPASRQRGAVPDISLGDSNYGKY
jgi:methyl-accepting chemotaxis protein